MLSFELEVMSLSSFAFRLCSIDGSSIFDSFLRTGNSVKGFQRRREDGYKIKKFDWHIRESLLEARSKESKIP